MKMKKLAVVVATSVLAFAGTTHAQSEFGKSGAITINAQGGEPLIDPAGESGVGLTPFIGFDFRRTSEPDSRNENVRTDTRQTIFYLNPGLDYFVVDNLSIGGEVFFASVSRSHTDRDIPAKTETKYDDPSSTGWGIMPRVGYNIPLSRSFSFWPRGGLGYRSVTNSVGDTARGDTTDSYFLLFADALFMWHPAPHFFLGAGPGFSTTISRTWKQTERATGTTVSGDGDSVLHFRLLSAVIGGWF